MFSNHADIDEVDKGLQVLTLLKGSKISLEYAEGWGPWRVSLAHSYRPFHFYLALLFSLIGIDFRIPRLFMAITGSLTVIFTYMFTSRMYDKHTGLLAGLLLATAPSHILIGRVGWSASLTPLFTSLCVLFLVEAHRDPRWLPLSFLMLGLAVQSHPVTLIFLAAVALYILFSARTWLKHRSYLLCAVAFFLLSVFNIPYYFLAEGSEAFGFIASGPPGGWGYEEYDRLLNQNIIHFLKFLTASKTWFIQKMVRKPHFYILPVIFIAGLSYHDYRRMLGDKILLLLEVMFFFAIPLRIHTVRRFPDTYGPHFYLFIIPFVYATIANFISRVSSTVFELDLGKLLRFVFSFSLLIVVVSYNLWALNDVQTNMYSQGDTNEPFIEVVRYVQSLSGRSEGLHVLVDARVPFALELKRLIEFSTGGMVPTYYWEEKGILPIQIFERRYPVNAITFVTSPESSESSVFLELHGDASTSEIYRSDGKHIYTLHTKIWF